MDNIRAVVAILFKHISEQDVYDRKVLYNKVPLSIFVALSNSYIVRYSNDEVCNLYHYLKDELKWMRHKIYFENGDDAEQQEINVFDALYLFAGGVLTEEAGQPVCQYLHFLRWHEMSKEIDEDSIITSYLAFKDTRFGVKRKNFFWKPVIGHNSQALNRILEKGIAENHFHLKGSAPLFQVSWISLMNDVNNFDFERELKAYDERRLKRKIAYMGGYSENSLYTLYILAACIRMYLFRKIKAMVDTSAHNIDEEINVDSELLLFIENPGKAVTETKKLQGIVDFCQNYYNNEYDYAICEANLTTNPNQGLNEILSGERWFLYEMFSMIYSREKGRGDLFQLFYLYLIIKNTIRSEMIQVNENIGFSNFLLYQERKDKFVENTKYEPVYIKMAVRDTILNQHIKKLEARITPKNTAVDDMRYIQKMDGYIVGEGEKADEELRERFFYVVHFIKEKENSDKKQETDYRYRHFLKREEVEMQAKALAKFREDIPEYAKRIRGIDASSEEIWCRPEIFAQAFRFLKSHQPDDEVFLYNSDYYELPQLRCTYHVGEDFLDVVDGLRAIDEAILFLNLKCGDRLGHALALGVDIDEWYALKANLLLISKMDHLDNLAWLYSKIRKYRLKDCDDAINYIHKRYDELIKVVYKQYSKHSSYNFSIESYYDAWKLRGDNPEYYKDEQFKIENTYADKWDYHAINREFPNNYKIRYDSEVAYLYYLYQFDKNVRNAGSEMVEVYVNPAIANVVKQVQKRMQIEICERGIGIETNPSSNCFIGSFKRYDKHPIKDWYNCGLTNVQTELEECPQLLVSINTDDQGVFNTCLENEYAYLALGLEKIKNADGTPGYKRTMILQWLDNIREIGLEQSFL